MNKYQWPVSRLDENEMALLFREREKTGRSICELLRLAVHLAYSDVKTEKEVYAHERKK